MIVSAARRVHSIVRRLHRRRDHRVVILLYHRVSEQRVDPWSLNVTPQHFAEQLTVLRQRFHLMGLQGLVQALVEGRTLPSRSVVVTFDDGYADNLYRAQPILERHQCPATVFLTSGAIGRKRGFWWDELGFLLQPGSLPTALSLTANGRRYSWQLGTDAHYTPQAFEQHHSWKAATASRGTRPPTVRQVLYHSIWEVLHPLSPGAQQRVLDELLDWAGSPSLNETAYPVLSTDEVRELAQGRLIEIGAHTVNHLRLAAFPPAVQQSEIQKSKADLEGILKQPVTSFSYPFGKHEDFSPETVSLVREAGLTVACTNISACASKTSDRFQLPRVHVPDLDGPAFRRWLDCKFVD